MLTYAGQVSIRAFLPVWVFLYVVQFLLMPVIARDYWVSLFFGNLLYLVAFGYYFVITFLGYNGTFCVSCIFSSFARWILICVLSTALPPPYPPPPLPNRGTNNPLVHKSFRPEPAQAFCSSIMGRCRLEEVCIESSVMYTSKVLYAIITLPTMSFHNP